jgi:hypothetical protein
MASTFSTATHTNRHTGAGTSTARALAHRLLHQVEDLVGFLDGADLRGELELDVSANLAGALGMVDRAVRAIEAAGQG